MSLIKKRQVDAGPNVGQIVHMEDLGAGRFAIQFALSDTVFIEMSAIDNGDGSYDIRITPPGGGDGLTISADTGGNISYSLTSAIQSTIQSLVSLLLDAPTIALNGNLNFNTPGGTIENLIAIGHEKNSVTTPLTLDDMPIPADINILTLTQNQGIDSFIDEPTTNDRKFTLVVKQDGTGGWNITSWPTSVIWPGGLSSPTIPSGANQFAVIEFTYDGTNHHGVVSSTSVSSGSSSINKSTLTTGTGSAYVLTNSNIPTLELGDVIAVRFHTPNTIAGPTINVNGEGAQPLLLRDGDDWPDDAIEDYVTTDTSGKIYYLQFDLTNIGGFAVIGSSGPHNHEEVTASANVTQINFTTAICITNASAFNFHSVYRNGILQDEGASNDYIVTGRKQITFNLPMVAGERILIKQHI